MLSQSQGPTMECPSLGSRLCNRGLFGGQPGTGAECRRHGVLTTGALIPPAAPCPGCTAQLGSGSGQCERRGAWARAAGWGRDEEVEGQGAASCCAGQYLPPAVAAQQVTQEESNLQSRASETPVNACIALVLAAGDGTECKGDGMVWVAGGMVCTGDGTAWAQMRAGGSVGPGAAPR